MRRDHSSQSCHPNLEPLESRFLLSGTPDLEAVQLFNASPALFVENAGQWADAAIRYACNGSAANVLFTDAGPVVQVFKSDLPVQGEDELYEPLGADDYATQFMQFSVGFDGANAVTATGLEQSGTYFNYFVGDQAAWRTNVSSYQVVAYTGLYSGIDLLMSGRRDSLKYEFRVAPGADYTQIQISYTGIEGLYVDAEGTLHVQTALGELTDDAPTIYQEIGGVRTDIAGSFQLVDSDTYTFVITGSIDPSAELVIDPNLAWSTYLGGLTTDKASAVAADSDGSVVVAGETRSPGWVSGGFDPSYNGLLDAFVAKLDSAGQHLWSTYLGGTSNDAAMGVDLDASGDILVAGITSSMVWVSGGADTSYNGGPSDAFVAKLSSAGGHVWSTFVGGTGGDGAAGVAVDAAGNVLLAGYTNSAGWASGGYDTTLGGMRDGFVAKLDSSSTPVWSTYVGGPGSDEAAGIAVDAAGDAAVTGYTDSGGWVSGGYDTTFDGGIYDAFVVKVSSGGGHVWSSYLGGLSMDRGYGVAVDSAGNVLAVGATMSPGWVSGGYDTVNDGMYDGYVVKMSAAGGHVWSSFLGGFGSDSAYAVAADASGAVLVTGETASPGWVSGGFDTDYDGGRDAFVAKLDASGGHAWSSYMGGTNVDRGYGIAMDASGATLVAGDTASYAWISGGYDTTYGGSYDGFVARITEAGAPLAITEIGLDNTEIYEGGSVTLTGSFTDPDTGDTHTVTVDWGDGNVETVTLTVGDRAFALSHTYVDDDPTSTPVDEYAIGVTVDDGSAGDTGSTAVWVLNADPVVTISTTVPGPMYQYEYLDIEAAFTDAGLADIHVAQIEWGDGTVTPVSDLTGGAIAGSHYYVGSGTYTITVRVIDDDGGTGLATLTVNVMNTNAALADLVQQVEDADLSTGVENSLTAKLAAAARLLEQEVENDAPLEAILNAFIRGVNHWESKGDLTAETATQLRFYAELVRLDILDDTD